MGRKDPVELRSLVFEREPTNDEEIETKMNLRDRSLGGVARALHEDWVTTSGVLSTTNLAKGHFSEKDMRKISVYMQKFIYNLVGTLSEELILPQSMEVVYELYRQKGLSAFFTQAVRCSVFSAISNNRLVTEFFDQFTKDGTLRPFGEDRYSEYLTKTIEQDFDHVPSKDDLTQLMLKRGNDSNLASDFTTFLHIVDDEKKTDLKSVTLLDICLEYCRQTQTYRSRVEVVLD